MKHFRDEEHFKRVFRLFLACVFCYGIVEGFRLNIFSNFFMSNSFFCCIIIGIFTLIIITNIIIYFINNIINIIIYIINNIIYIINILFITFYIFFFS